MSKEQKSKRTRIDLYNLIKDRKNIFNKNNMETKYVRVPFEVELAKKITNGECDGRIVTRDGMNARIICCDKKSGSIYSIVALLDANTEEFIFTYTVNGFEVLDIESDTDLMLEIPEYMTFKDGDILICECGTPFVYKDTKDRHGNFSAYCGIDLQGNIFFDMKGWTYSIKGHANEEQKKNIIEALKTSKEPKAKEYLKRFFNIEQKQEYEFKPFDKVLVKDHDEDSEWRCDLFSRKNEDGLYICVGSIYEQCIPYEGNEHLLGTTDKMEEK